MKLLSHQEKAVDFILKNESSALFFEQGTGKTFAVLQAIKELKAAKVLLIVLLNNLETTWKASIPKFLKTPILSKPQEFDSGIYLIHYEGLVKQIKWIKKQKWDMIVIDESQRLKNRNSKQSKSVKMLAGAPKKVILSGTPVEQCPEDLWAQFRFLAPEVLSPRWGDFKEDFLESYGFMGKQLRMRKDRLPEFIRRISPFMLRVTKDVLDLPPIRLIKHSIPLLGNQREVYESMKKDMVTLVDGHQIMADLTIVQLIKLQQICGGFISDEDQTFQTGEAKLRRLKSILKVENKPIVIFCNFLQEILLIKEELKNQFSIGVLSGQVKPQERVKLIGDFQNGKLDLLICQLRTGGVGIDLYRSNIAIFYSMSWSYIDYSQALSRVHRFNQDRVVKIFLLFAKRTIDEIIFKTILEKQSVSEIVLKRSLYVG